MSTILVLLVASTLTVCGQLHPKAAGITSVNFSTGTRDLVLTQGGFLEAAMPSLLQHIGGANFFIVQDRDSQAEVASVIRVCGSLGVSVVLYNHSTLLQEATQLLKTYHSQSLKTFIVVCNISNVVSFFDKIRAESLESSKLQWLILSTGGASRRIEPSLREGTQVVVAEKTSEDHYELFASRIDPDDVVRFRKVGTLLLKEKEPRLYTKERLLPDLNLLYSDFRGREIKVAVVDNWPFFKLQELPDGTMVPHSGIDVNVLNALAEKLNFTYRIVVPVDQQWGNPQPDGTVTGIIGEVANYRAHIAINEITITGRRDTVVDFTKPYFLESTTILSKAPEPLSRALAVFSPFTFKVWLLLAATVPAVALVIYLFVAFHRRRLPTKVVYCNAQDIVLNVFRNMVVQGSLLPVHATSVRMAFFTWYFFCYLIYALYAGTLTAFLAIPAFEKPIDSLQDFMKATESRGTILGVLRDSSNEMLFRDATSGLYKEVWDKSYKGEASLANTSDHGVEKVVHHNIVYVHAHMAILIRAMQQGRKRFHLAKESFYPQGYGVVCRSGSPFVGRFEQILSQMTSAGLVNKWTQDEIESRRNSRRLFAASSGASKEIGAVDVAGAITLMQVQAAFYLLALGFGASVVVLLVEIFRHQRKFHIKIITP